MNKYTILWESKYGVIFDYVTANSDEEILRKVESDPEYPHLIAVIYGHIQFLR